VLIRGEPLSRHQFESNRLALEKEELEKAHQQVIEELGQLRYKYVGLILQNSTHPINLAPVHVV
jgi:ABC-type phosphate transport system auxiliary subunit